MSTEINASDFEAKLRQTRERYRQKDIGDRLADLARQMEETLLQKALAEAFFDTSFEVEPDAQEVVRDGRTALIDGDYGRLDAQLDDIQNEVGNAKRRVENNIQPSRLSNLERVRAMQRLNERVERVDPERLSALESLLDDWNWRGHVELGKEPFEEALREAREVGEDLRGHYEELQEELFGPYRDTEIWPIVESLLDDERLTYGSLTDEERRLLAESDLSEYVELTLS